MTRLQLELQRLYLPAPGTSAPGDMQLLAADGTLRAMVLELHGPASWAALSRIWHGVQAQLALPAPAIAVSGVDGYQLWFSLQQPVPAMLAAAFLDALRQRHLADIPLRRLRMLPDAGTTWQPAAVPARQADAEQWSAFVSQDLAPMFEDTPWLDTPPNPDGQAGLLAPLRSISPADFQQALQACGLAAGLPEPAPAPVLAAPSLPPAAAVTPAEPRQFLLAVMQDPAVPMALRIEAAKALLAHPHPA